MISAKAELASARSRLEEASSSIVLDTSKQFELSKLERDVTSNRQLYESFLAKFEESDLSSQYTLTNAQIVDEARVPGAPIRPDTNKFVLQWGFMGFLCGILLALFREQLHNKFRTNEDIEQKLALPVLAIEITFAPISIARPMAIALARSHSRDPSASTSGTGPMSTSPSFLPSSTSKRWRGCSRALP